MGLSVYLVFNDGKTENAIEHYKNAFQTAPPHIQRFNEMPGYEKHTPAGYETRILHATLEIFGDTVMFSDTLPGQEHTVGNNVTIAAKHSDALKIQHAFKTLAENGEIIMELQATPWSKLYGQVVDQYGVLWQFNQEV